WRCTRAFLPGMIEAGRGSIVNIASAPAFQIIPGCFPYPVAKHAVVGLTRALAIEYAARGIRVNAIAPGYIETPIATEYWNTFPDPELERRRAYELHPPKRIGRPEEVGWTAVFLASDEAPFINAATIVIDGRGSVLYHEGHELVRPEWPFKQGGKMMRQKSPARVATLSFVGLAAAVTA